ILSPYLNQKILVWVGAVIVFIFLLFVVGRIIGTRKNRQAVYAGSSLKKPVVFEPIKPRVSRITGEPVRQPVTSTIRLVMRARESCYIQLKTDGHLVFNSTLKKGKVETWVAKEKNKFFPE
ncbi:MAG: hypothetical protein NT033_10695, partial [Candidatus Omnitrophica bacterium]|nr:hypothetical protein [Candidatus Omnitrophota bacterium]